MRLSLRCKVKSAPLTRAGICENTGASRAEKARPWWCHQTGRYHGDYGISARLLLSQRRIFCTRPCSSLSGKKQEIVIISGPSFGQLIRRGSTMPASYLPSQLPQTWAQQVLICAFRQTAAQGKPSWLWRWRRQQVHHLWKAAKEIPLRSQTKFLPVSNQDNPDEMQIKQWIMTLIPVHQKKKARLFS